MEASPTNRSAIAVSPKPAAILSIDGGGVRGLIPAQILEFLESELQVSFAPSSFPKLDGPKARIADYFDVISGTSTGGLMAAMLASSNSVGRPLFAAKDITPFYLQHSEHIFPPSKWKNWPLVGKGWEALRMIRGPKYDGKYLHRIIADRLGDSRLRDTVTGLVIPSFDIKLQQPAIFSTFQANELKNPLLRDICIGTSAAPTYLPPHCFALGEKDPDGNPTYFNLIDGGIAANNPTIVAMDEVAKERVHRNPKLLSGSAEAVDRFLVLSLGTGQEKHCGYLAEDTAKWGALDWVSKNSSMPIIETLMEASSDMADIQVGFRFRDAEDNYLRIQAVGLEGDVASIDLATKENLKNLVDIGKKLLNKEVTRVHLERQESICQCRRGIQTRMLSYDLQKSSRIGRRWISARILNNVGRIVFSTLLPSITCQGSYVAL